MKGKPRFPGDVQEESRLRQAVDGGYAVPRSQQYGDECRPEITGGAGDEQLHTRVPEARAARYQAIVRVRPLSSEWRGTYPHRCPPRAKARGRPDAVPRPAPSNRAE